MIGLGTWKISKESAETAVYNAIKEAGIRHIDCACDYGNEVEVGLGIKRAIDEGVVKREELWITSKLWNTYHRPEHVEPAFRRSLQDLNLEYLDLYLIHFPISLKFVPFEVRYPPEWVHDPKGADPRIELDERAPMHLTWAAMEALLQLPTQQSSSSSSAGAVAAVGSGPCRRIGVCNFNVQLLMDLLCYANVRPYLNQVELHPYLPQQELLEYCLRNSVRCTAFSPLGSASYAEMGMDQGLGSGLLAHPVVQEVAAAHEGKTAAQVLLRWNIERGASVVPKAGQLAHLKENAAIFDFSLTPEEVSGVTSYEILMFCRTFVYSHYRYLN